MKKDSKPLGSKFKVFPEKNPEYVFEYFRNMLNPMSSNKTSKTKNTSDRNPKIS